MCNSNNILSRWEITIDELTKIVDSNPSLRGFVFGYVSEYQLRKILSQYKEIQHIEKPDDHNRKRKEDFSIKYKDTVIRLEVKSLQTKTIERTEDGWKAKFQCDASDRRTVTLPNGQKIETTCLVVGEFDLLAVCLFPFEQKWKFAFAHNHDLPRTKAKKYSLEQQQYLLATLMEITWPLQPPFSEDPITLLDEAIRRKTMR